MASSHNQVLPVLDEITWAKGSRLAETYRIDTQRE